ncbi:MAG: glycosyltransferase [Pseudomonadota bacterium]
MNILMLTNTYTPHIGGVARSVASFSAAYRALGHRVLVIAPVFEGMPKRETDVIRVPAIQHFNGSDFSMPVPVPHFLNSSLEQFRPDIVHSHHPFLLGDTALRIAAMRNLPVVFTHHTQYERYTHYIGSGSPRLQRFIMDLVRGYCTLCDAVIAPSASIAEVLRNNGVATRIEVIPTGVDLTQFNAGDGHAARAALRIPADAFVVGHVGRLAPEKNLDFLTDAVAAFLHRHRRAHFLVVGSGPMEQDMRRRFDEQDLSARLHLSGNLQGRRLADAYQAMDAFAFASQSETQGMVLVEAMAAGVPVVAVDAAGVREVVRDRHNGRLLAHEDTAEFAAALAWLAARPRHERETLAAAARATAENFSMPRCARRALALYESLCGAGRAEHDNSVWRTALRLIDNEWKILANRASAAGAALKKSADSPRSTLH